MVRVERREWKNSCTSFCWYGKRQEVEGGDAATCKLATYKLLLLAIQRAPAIASDCTTSDKSGSNGTGGSMGATLEVLQKQ